eukprot:snap_masked-scaffold_4-processed-gene-16.28-mRNA-1 protein AED:1.00 eAED:1.00 QI:0/0/0/0/1/1/3/0/65
MSAGAFWNQHKKVRFQFALNFHYKIHQYYQGSGNTTIETCLHFTPNFFILIRGTAELWLKAELAI